MDEPQQPPPIITSDAIARWSQLPPDKALQIPLTRDHLDYLFVSIRNCIVAQSELGAAVLALSNADKETAQKLFSASEGRLRTAIEQIDRLIVHAMTNAEPI